LKRESDQFPVSRTSAVVSLAVITSLLGCQSGAFDWVPSPFSESERTSYMTPPKRIDRLEQLAAEASRKKPAEQEQISQELARQIQREEDPLIREQILRTLTRYPTATSRSVLRAALKDHDSAVRITACRLVAEHGDDPAAALAEVVRSDTDVDVRIAATRELGRFGEGRVVSALGEALEDRDPALQLAAMDSLERTTGEDYGHDAVAWKQYVRGETPTPSSPTLAERLQSLNPF